MSERSDATDDGAWRDEQRLPLAELSRAVATSSMEGQADDATGGEAGPESAYGDEPFPAARDLDAVGDARADGVDDPERAGGVPLDRGFDRAARSDHDPDPTSEEGRALRPSPQGRIGPV